MESENSLLTEGHELVMCRQPPMAGLMSLWRRYVPCINENLIINVALTCLTGYPLTESSSLSGISAQFICTDLPIQHLEQ